MSAQVSASGDLAPRNVKASTGRHDRASSTYLPSNHLPSPELKLSFYPSKPPVLARARLLTPSTSTHHGRLRLQQPQPQCGSACPGRTSSEGDEYWNNYRWMSIRGRSGDCSRYTSNEWAHSSGQGKLGAASLGADLTGTPLTAGIELRKATLHSSSDLVCWRRNCRRYRIHNCHHFLKPGTPRPLHWPQAPRRNLHDNAQTTPLPLPRSYWSLSRRCRCRPHGFSPLHCTRSRQHGQASLRNNGFWLPRRDVSL